MGETRMTRAPDPDRLRELKEAGDRAVAEQAEWERERAAAKARSNAAARERQIAYRGFIIVPKRDFGEHGHYSYGYWIKSGWVVTFGSGEYEGCNAMPGATWFSFVDEAMRAIDIYLELSKGLPKDESQWTALDNRAFTDGFWKRIRKDDPQFRVRVLAAAREFQDEDDSLAEATHDAEVRKREEQLAEQLDAEEQEREERQ